MSTKTEQQGVIAQVIGNVVDVKFEGTLPEIYHTIEVVREQGTPQESPEKSGHPTGQARNRNWYWKSSSIWGADWCAVSPWARPTAWRFSSL